MKLKSYLKERSSFIWVNILFFTAVSIVLLIFKMNIIDIVMLMLIWFAPLMSYIGLEYLKFNKYITQLHEVSEELEKSYLMSEVIKEPHFLEGKLIHQSLKTAHRAMLEEIKREKDVQRDYKEYIETWVHEIKTPLASIGLMTQNEDTPTMRNVAYEARRIHNYIEQVLYYARSGEVKSDYLVKPFILREVVMEEVKQYRTDFIRRKIGIEVNELDLEVYSDRKWVSFMISQILGNAIKYMGDNQGKIKIYGERSKNKVILTIEDEGVGINSKDIKRVFDKGFTGENGRQFGKSTGIGLYLCKQLCNKLGLSIRLSSVQGSGTKVQLIFPIGDECILL